MWFCTSLGYVKVCPMIWNISMGQKKGGRGNDPWRIKSHSPPCDDDGLSIYLLYIIPSALSPKTSQLFSVCPFIITSVPRSIPPLECLFSLFFKCIFFYCQKQESSCCPLMLTSNWNTECGFCFISWLNWNLAGCCVCAAYTHTHTHL